MNDRIEMEEVIETQESVVTESTTESNARRESVEDYS